jgi:hypothetical protein
MNIKFPFLCVMTIHYRSSKSFLHKLEPLGMCHFGLHFDHTMFCLRSYHWRCSRNSNFEKFIKLKPITKPCERSMSHGDCMVAPHHDVCVHISFTRFPITIGGNCQLEGTNAFDKMLFWKVVKWYLFLAMLA